ncbi:MAG: AraC family transcriptional regulator, partial [Pirellulales bacterium]
MANAQTDFLRFRTLYESDIVKVREYRCCAARGGPEGEEYSTSNDVVLMRHGVFCRHSGRHTTTADINQAMFFPQGATYRVSHPADCGDCGTVFTASPNVLAEILCDCDASICDSPAPSFPFLNGPCGSDAFWRHHELVRKIKVARDSVESIQVDVTALQLIAGVTEAAFERYNDSRKPRRSTTVTDHADRTEAAKCWLANRLSQRITLGDVAHSVQLSPFHFARMFQRQTGVPVYGYLTWLRLRTSIERLADGERDLTQLALDLGFSSHSHFSDSFRREFGRTPSDARDALSSRTIREMSK